MLIALGTLVYLIVVGAIIAAAMRSSQMSAAEGPFEVPIADRKVEPLRETNGAPSGSVPANQRT